MARFYADEDFPGPVVDRLRALGHDVVTVQEAGGRGSDDSQVLADATADNRAVLTHNRRLSDVSMPVRLTPASSLAHATRTIFQVWPNAFTMR